MVYNEANNGVSGDGWGADGILTKLFDQDYQELYARIWFRTQAGWKWSTNSDMMIKVFRTKHFDRSGSVFLNASGGNNAPVYFWDFKHSNSWGTRWMATLRCDPQATDYSCVTAVPSDKLFILNDMSVEPNASGMPADTAWHRLDFHVKMNTYDTLSSSWNSDGIYEFSYDGVIKDSYNNIAWKRTGSNEQVGWNTIDLGGNAYNSYNNSWIDNHNYVAGDTMFFNSYNWIALQDHLSSDEPGISNRPAFASTAYWQNTGLIAEQKEQWYAIDDVVVSTTAIPENYTIGNIDTVAPQAPSVLSVQ